MALHGTLTVKIPSAKGLANKDKGLSGLSDPYAIVFIDGKEKARTIVIDNNLNPKWNAEFDFDLAGDHRELAVEVWNKNTIFRDDFLGVVRFSFQEILSRGKLSGKQSLKPRTNADQGIKGAINLKIRYRPHSRLDSYQVKKSAFPMRRGCNVTLFQDAHVCEDELPPQFADVREWLIPNNAFEEIYSAMVNAKKFIYITGWSVNPAISLLRRRALYGNEMLTMGELLRMKADVEGVRVLLHLWDEKLSMDIGPFTTSGVMSTFDEVTKQYFQNSKVTVKLSYRTGSFTGELYWSHHQKTVILDAQNNMYIAPKPGKKMKQMPTRRIIAFVGGLDLTSGRWDTPAHSLFKSLKSEHRDDYHQPWNIPQDHGPRQPWHDIHTKVEGMIARDVLANFEQRWRKQATDSAYAGALYDINNDKDIVGEKHEKGKKSMDPEAWNVQLFRSIDYHSAVLPPTRAPDGSEKKNVVERGIQDAYINAIRVAKQFIYIENQYFMGSAPAWSTEKDSGCNNGIPFEIATKIATSLQNGRPFYAYIVLPMFPEGVPSEKALQEMLRWQWLTMEMMYKKIGDAIRQYGPGGAHPTDFLNFYCLGNREKVEGTASPPNFLPPKTKRFMIYVHSKLLIADDEYILCGSANINERSMAGDRDSEIVVGAYQPNKKSAEQVGYSSGGNPMASQSWPGYGSGNYTTNYTTSYGSGYQQPIDPNQQQQPYGYQSQSNYQQPGFGSTAAPGFQMDPYRSGYGNQYPQAPQPYAGGYGSQAPPPQPDYYNSGYGADRMMPPGPGNNPGFPMPYQPGYESQAPPPPGYQSGFESYGGPPGGYPPPPGGYQPGYESYAPGYPAPGYVSAPAPYGPPGGYTAPGYVSAPAPHGPPGGYPAQGGYPAPSGGYPAQGSGSGLNAVVGLPSAALSKIANTAAAFVPGITSGKQKSLPVPNYNRNLGIPFAELKAIEHPVYGTLPAVKRFRISLWAEHTATFMADYMQPHNVETVRKLNAIAEANWKIYSGDTIEEMHSHLMKYPIDVDSAGRITPKCVTFPDTTANIMGSSSPLIPNLITQ